MLKLARTFLKLLQDFANSTGLTEPSQIIGAVDEQSKQFLALANQEAADFARLANGQGGWQNLHQEYTFTTVAGTGDYALPADFSYFANRTFWDGAMRWELLGPISAQEKQILRYGIVANGPRRKWYIRRNRMYLDPVPGTTGDVVAYDYYSNSFCQSPEGEDQNEWKSDDDTYLLDEDCFIKGMKWRFLRAKGLDYGQEYTDYQAQCSESLSRDGGTPDLNLAYSDWTTRLLNDDNIPDTGFGGV